MPALLKLRGGIVEVFCRCDREVAEERYRARASSRARGHFDNERTSTELWNAEVSQPVAGGWPVVEVNTSQAVDVAQVTGRVLAAIRATT